MRADTDAVLSLDTITLSETDGPVNVTYRAELELKGMRQIVDPLTTLALARDAKEAAGRLTEKLSS